MCRPCARLLRRFLVRDNWASDKLPLYSADRTPSSRPFSPSPPKLQHPQQDAAKPDVLLALGNLRRPIAMSNVDHCNRSPLKQSCCVTLPDFLAFPLQEDFGSAIGAQTAFQQPQQAISSLLHTMANFHWKHLTLHSLP